MILVINGEKHIYSIEVLSLLELLDELKVTATKGVAVALNDSVVAHSDWASTSLQSGDRIEVISPFQGG